MKQRLSLTDKSIKVLAELNKAPTDTAKLVILNELYNDASNHGASDTEEFFKSQSRVNTAKLITIWFYSVNILTVLIILSIFIKEVFSSTLGTGIINSSVLISLIGATVAQNATAFLLFAKYAFNSTVANKSNNTIPTKAISKI